MDVHAAPFAHLDTLTLYGILRLRSEVFVVEQACPYLDLDGRDTEPGTWHVWTSEGEGAPLAYLRVLDDGGEARIGRVVTAPEARGRGLADGLMRRALELVGDREVVLDAQAHLERWYERYGFVRSGDEFVEDGIPHVPMRRTG